ncbi:MAG: F0F1 ATP synthase subunit B [Pseudomonadota bacterium]|nr:F0F1 ATP synthase subunit B [Pseudomonadota bacterium]
MSINITLVIQGLAFFAVAWLVMKFGWPNMIAAIEERQKKIAEGLAAADRAKAELAAADNQAAEEVRAARIKAAEILDKANHQANAAIEKGKSDAIAEGNRQLATARAEIDSLSHRAKEELRKQVGQLAIAGAEKILKREIDAKAHTALLDQLASEI